VKQCRHYRLELVVSLVFLAAGCGGGSVTTSPPPPPIVTESITITTDANIQCVQSVPFSMVLTAQGNVTPLTWSIASGQLPTGLSLDAATGTISGTPASGLGVASIQAADAKAITTKQFNFTVFSRLTITPLSPANAHINAPYSLSVGAQASSAVASWAISAGQLPPGLTFAVNHSYANIAIISGTPTQVGTYAFTISVRDYTLPQTVTLDTTIVVDSHFAITKPTLQNGGQNLAYTDSFAAVNGQTPYHWSINGALPAGIALNSSTGKVTGTPTDFGSFSYTVTVTDSSTPVQTDSGQGLLNIAKQLQILAYLNPAYINVPYSSSFTSVGGSFPVTWSIRSGNLPPGLTLNADGYIFGTPTQLGAYNFVVQVTDSATPPYVVTQAITLNVTTPPLNILGDPLSPAPVNVVYHSQIPASGGTPPYSWSISSGSLPPGLTLNAATGFIDGTPTQNGTYNFTVRGADSGNPVQTATANDFIIIQHALGRNDSIATATPLGNSQNVSNPVVLSISPYIDPIGAATANPDTDFYKLVAAGGGIVHVETFAQRSWIANPLDTVIELLDQNGARLHSCTQPNYAASCLNDDIDSSTRDSALDLKVPGAPNATTTFYVHVLDWRGDARPDMLYYLNISGVIEPLTISPSTLGAGATRGVNYQQQFTASGGSGQVAWALAGGALPPGWGLSFSGLLSGVATTDGFYTFAIKATDSANPPQTRQVQFSLQIADPLVITTSPILPNACVNKPYTFQMLTSGGLPPIAFSAGSNTLWVGINVDPQTGLFTGSSSVTGTFMTGAGAIDSAQPPSVAGQQIILTVVNCP
jgi:hypothetical protein